jgi:hypothetical protein
MVYPCRDADDLLRNRSGLYRCARAYNGVCTRLVTADGADIASATGYVRAPLTFPTRAQ